MSFFQRLNLANGCLGALFSICLFAPALAQPRGDDVARKLLPGCPKGSFVPLDQVFPQVQPAGLTGDGVDFWILDGSSKRIYHYNGGVNTIFRNEIQLSLAEPSGVAFDGKALLVGDALTKRLYYIDAITGGKIRSIPSLSPLDRNSGVLKDVSWDGKSIWTAVASGFASSFNQIDPKDGRLIRSLHANCNPRGLTVRAGQLWSLCYNGERLPDTIKLIRLADRESETQRSARPLGSLESPQAAGLLFDGRLLWTLEVSGPRCLAAGEAADPK